MSDSFPLEVLVSGVTLAGGGIYGLFRTREIASRNRAFVDSGKEAYFEQRRAWEHYPSQRPATEPDKVRRYAWISLVTGGLLLATSIVLILFAPE